MPDIYISSIANKPFKEGATAEGVIKGTRITHVNYDGGIFAHYEGAEFPMKGYPTQEAVVSVNIMKSIFMQVFKLRPTIKSIIIAFNTIGSRVLEAHFLKDEYRTAGTRELKDILSNFVFSLTSNRNISDQFAQIFSHLLEYDNAYRLRFVDLATETSKEKLLENPRKEIKRLLEIVIKREVFLGKEVSDKFKYVQRFLSVILLIPRFRKAFKTAIEKSNWDNMIYDDKDAYWACLRTDYDFMGYSASERLMYLKSFGYSMPVQNEYKI